MLQSKTSKKCWDLNTIKICLATLVTKSLHSNVLPSSVGLVSNWSSFALTVTVRNLQGERRNLSQRGAISVSPLLSVSTSALRFHANARKWLISPTPALGRFFFACRAWPIFNLKTWKMAHFHLKTWKMVSFWTSYQSIKMMHFPKIGALVRHLIS